MAKEIIINAKINTGNSANDVKEVATTTSELRGQISATEKEVDRMSKAYGENSKQADNARKELAKLNIAYDQEVKAADAAANSVINLNAKFEDVYGDLQPLSGRLGEIEDRMYELALAGKENTEEFKALQKEVVRYRETIVSVDAAVDGLAQRGGNINAALQLGEGVVQGYQGFLGVSALLGNENERLMQTMVKLQAAQGVVNSLGAIQQALNKDSLLTVKAKTIATLAETKAQAAYGVVVGTSTGAMKAFKVALAATGIGALIVGIGLLIANFEDLVNWVKNLGNRFEVLRPIIDYFKKQVDDVKASLQALGLIDSAETERAKKLAQARIEAREKEREELGKRYDFEIAKAQAAGKNTYEIEQEKRKAILETLKVQALAIQQQVKLTGEFTEEQKEALRGLVDLAKSTAQEITVAQIGENKRKNDVINQNNQQNKDRLKEIEAKERADEAEEEEMFLDFLQTKNENILAIDDDFYNKKKEQLDQEIADEEEARLKRIRVAKEEKELAQSVYDAKLGLASMATSAILANMEEGSNAAKGIAAAQVVFDTYRGIQSTFASAAANPTSILFPAQPYIQAGVAAAFGFANVRKIMAASPASPSGSSSGGVGGSRSTLSSSVPTSNPINLFGNAFQGADKIGESRKSLKVEISENEITKSQKNVINYNQSAMLE